MSIELNRVYFGDSFELIETIPDNFIDLIVTSPPYANMTNYGSGINIFHPDNYPDWILPLIDKMYYKVKDSGSFILNINDNIQNYERTLYVFETIIKIKKETNWKYYDLYFWYKKSALPATQGNRLVNYTEYLFHFVKDPKKMKYRTDRIREPYAPSTITRMKYESAGHNQIDEDGFSHKNPKKMEPNKLGKIPGNVFRFQTSAVLRHDKDDKGGHPAPFHPELPEWFIKWLTDEGDVVLDPFMGSGSTAISCVKNNRKYIGFELNENYRDKIQNRLKEVDFMQGKKNKFFD